MVPVLGDLPSTINKRIELLKAREVTQAALAAAASNLADQENSIQIVEEEVEEEEFPLNEEHIKLVESVLVEELILPSEVDPLGNQKAEGMGKTDPSIRK